MGDAIETRRRDLMFGARGKRLIPFFVFAWLTCAHAQYELPNEIFARTLRIRSGNEMATAFKFDHGGRIYLVTTRHLGKTLPLRNAVVQIWHGSWVDLQTTQTLLPVSEDVELAILETNEKLGRPYKVGQSSEVLTTGQKVWYMGWAYPIPRPNMPIKALPPEVPSVWIGTITSIDPSRLDSFEIRAEKGYSLRIASGPIVYWSPVHRDFEVLGVIERNERDAVNGPIERNPPEKVVKSRILRGYSFDVVMDAINKDLHPVGGR
jgi:hypothetical protein